MDELISRQAALDCFHDWVDKYGDVHTADEMVEYQRIEALPSAQPDLPDICVGDMISREAAIDAVHKALYPYVCGAEEGDVMSESDLMVLELNKAVCTALKALPSAQADLNEWCTDCKEYDHVRHCCPRFNRVIRETVEEIQHAQRVESVGMRWTSCAERLPEEGRMVIVTIKGHDVIRREGDETLEEAIDRVSKMLRVDMGFIGSDGWYGADGYPMIVTPVAWCPLPEPWKGEE